jgi:hypothetical protein
MGAVASGARGIYRGFAIAGVSLFVSAALVLLLPKKQIAGPPPPGVLDGSADVR